MASQRGQVYVMYWMRLLLLARFAVGEPWTQENAAWNINFETSHDPVRYWGKWENHTYFPSPPDWRSLVIYQLITDRFADGDPHNNELFASGFDVRDMTFRHGGDFVGLTKKLHYIKGLGCNGIWISPVFQNGPNFYHQYAQLDFTVLDKRLGTLEELRDLVKEAHALNMYVIIDVVMNHMANEFYFDGHSKSSAAWRFHEDDGKREYKLKPRVTQAMHYWGQVWCGDALWQSFGNEPTGDLVNMDSCEDRCNSDPDCFFFLWKDDLGSLSTYHCAGFRSCDARTPYTDGNGHIYQKWVWPVKAVQEASDVWCGGAALWQDFGDEATGRLFNQDSCEAACASDDSCQFYLWKDDPAANTRFHCAGFATCAVADQTPFGDGDASKIFRKRTTAERDEDGLYHTPAGRQPYADFWYSNVWDAAAQYNGTLYGQWGESATDVGFGTYIQSDFHHNGDLSDYHDPWEINLGKIYGVMDDLRLENERVQQKYIAMTKALIDSTDVDGYRVDTPMQVPLNFYKVWAPAMRDHARTLGKDRFGIFGEFFVSPERYATMTGRGRDNTMYNSNQFIDDIATLKGGIVYPYYWYVFTAMVYQRPEYADGLQLAYQEENKMIDTYDPTTGRNEYAMWTFCNNHDNWRLQTMTGKPHFRMCLAIITFWPGVPLHYAGDEQDFDSPGSALDGWAREELVTSLSWRAVRTQPDGNPADGDNFDMTHASYLYIARLNALRRSYFGEFGNEECDQVQFPSYATPDVVVFVRGCNATHKVLVFASFHTTEDRSASVDALPWTDGTSLVDCLVADNPRQATVASGSISVSLSPLQALVFVENVAAVPMSVVEVSPKHGSSVELLPGQTNLTVSLRFDRPVQSALENEILLDQAAGGFTCQADTCTQVVEIASLSDGYHTLEIPEIATGAQLHATFRSHFMLDRDNGAVATPINEQPGLICSFGQQLCHKANGATWYRAQNVGGNWSEWLPFATVTTWQAQREVPVLVQYWSQLSAAFVVGDCLGFNGRCHASWHDQMFVRGELNNWGGDSDGRMKLVSSYTWASNITLSKFVRARLTPVNDWSKSYGAHPNRELLYNVPTFDPRHLTFDIVPTKSGTEPGRLWMTNRSLWTEHENLASGAEFAVDMWLSPLCNAAPPQCEPDPSASWQCHSYATGQDAAWCGSVGTEGCYEYSINDNSDEMSSCDPCYCCKRKVTQVEAAAETTCCLKFNDLFLNYTLTADLSQCAPKMPLEPVFVEASFVVSTQVGNSSNFGSLSDEMRSSLIAAALGNMSVNISVAKLDFAVVAEYELLNLSVSGLQAASVFCNFLTLDSSSTCSASGVHPAVRAEVRTMDLNAAMDMKALANDTDEIQNSVRNISSVAGNVSLNLVVPTVLEERMLVHVVSLDSNYNLADLVPNAADLAAQFSSEVGRDVVLSILPPPVTTSTTTTTTAATATTTTTTSSEDGSSTVNTGTSQTTSCVDLLVKSAGSQDGNFAEFYIDNMQINLTSGRGLSVVLLDAHGQVVEKHVFDTGYQGGGSAPLAALLNGLTEETGVLVAAMDDASDNLTSEAKDAIEGLGATQIDSLGYRGSYALIGVKGRSAVAEQLAASGEGPIQLSGRNVWKPECAPTTSAMGGANVLRVRSAGGADGNFAEFYADSVLIDLEAGRGLNVVVLGDNGQVLQKVVFDTGFEGDGSGPLASLLQGLSIGTRVLVAAMDDATDTLTEEAKDALKDLGATKIDDLGYRGSYALIGVKGGVAIAEGVKASGDGPVEVDSLGQSTGSSSSSSSQQVSESQSTTSSAESGTSLSTTSNLASVTSSSFPESPDVATTTKKGWEFSEMSDANTRIRWPATIAAMLMICMFGS